jgi:hypothetical protein
MPRRREILRCWLREAGMAQIPAVAGRESG